MMRGLIFYLRLFVFGFAAVFSACLDDPELRTCGEFPIGTPGCGEGCDVYCDEVINRCPGVFPNLETCLVDCALEPAGGERIPDGAFGESSGNTLSCRIAQAVAGRCDQVGLVDSRTCGSCAEYCSTMAVACVGAYPSNDNCMELCALLPAGTSDIDANTVECRLKFARRARIEPNLGDCNAASPSGGGVCGSDPCIPYCDLVLANCQGNNQVYADRTECLDTCRLFQLGDFRDWQFSREIDTLQCRIYHAGAPAFFLPDVHCPHTRVYNDEHCGVVPMLPEQPSGWPCVTFCDMTRRNCPGLYGSDEECRTACRAFPEVRDLRVGSFPNIYPVTSTVCPTQ